MFHCGLVRCGTLSWFISRGEYSSNTRAFFTIAKNNFNLKNKITVQMDNQLCSIETCDVCNNDKFATVEQNGPLTDLRKLKKSNTKINDNQKRARYDILNGNLNLLGWVVLKSNMVMVEKYDKTLAKLNIIESDKYWQNLVNTDIQRSVLFPDNYHESRFDNKEIPFHMLKCKFVSDYDVALKYLNEQYGLSIMDYRLYHPKLLKNDAFIEHYQKIHCDFDVGKPKSNLKKKMSNKSLKK